MYTGCVKNNVSSEQASDYRSGYINLNPSHPLEKLSSVNDIMSICGVEARNEGEHVVMK